MRLFASRHTQTEEFAEAVRPELQSLPVPEPSAALFDRIAASRTGGARVILPDVTHASTSSSRFVIPAVLVAAMLLVLLPLRRSSPPSSAGDVSSLSRIAGEWLPGSVAFAQSDASRTTRRSLPMTFSRPEKIRPIRLEYLRTWRDTARKEIGRMNGVISVARTESAGTPSWLVTSHNEGALRGKRFFTLDSVAIARNDLHLLRHTVRERPYSRYNEIRIEQIFRGDSILGSMHATGANVPPAARPIARRISSVPKPYILDPLAPIILGTVDLRSGWTGSASILGWTVRDDDVFIPIDLRVAGEETISVPAGRFDCWRLTIRFGNQSITSWARKSDGVGVRSIERDAAGVMREVVLRSEK